MEGNNAFHDGLVTDFLSTQPAAAQSHAKDGTGSTYPFSPKLRLFSQPSRGYWSDVTPRCHRTIGWRHPDIQKIQPFGNFRRMARHLFHLAFPPTGQSCRAQIWALRLLISCFDRRVGVSRNYVHPKPSMRSCFQARCFNSHTWDRIYLL